MDTNESDTSRIGSHIQMPKFLLKRFHNNGVFSTYDVKNKTIKMHSSATNTNIQTGYYSERFEKVLSKSIETRFGNTLKSLDTWNSEAEDLDIDFGPALDFIYALLARDPIIHEQVKNHSLVTLLPEQFQNEFIVATGFEIVKEASLFHEYNITVLFNQTKIPFVLPIMGIYYYPLNGYSAIILPVSPYMAICLIHKSYSSITDTSHASVSPLQIKNPEIIMRLNEFAFKAQVQRGQGVLICSESNELERLVNTIQVL